VSLIRDQIWLHPTNLKHFAEKLLAGHFPF
jgi:hypothetical protein